MDFGRLRSAEWFLGAMGLALLGVMFLDWYEGAGGEGNGLNGWQAFTVTDIVLAIVAVMAIAIFVATATQRTAAVAVALESLTGLLGIVATVFVFVEVLSVPDGYTRGIGQVFAFALVPGITFAAWIGLRNERPGHGAYARDGRERVTQIETLPAPKA